MGAAGGSKQCARGAARGTNRGARNGRGARTCSCQFVSVNFTGPAAAAASPAAAQRTAARSRVEAVRAMLTTWSHTVRKLMRFLHRFRAQMCPSLLCRVQGRCEPTRPTRVLTTSSTGICDAYSRSGGARQCAPRDPRRLATRHGLCVAIASVCTGCVVRQSCRWTASGYVDRGRHHQRIASHCRLLSLLTQPYSARVSPSCTPLSSRRPPRRSAS